jgi:tRNA G18 (ribose-2'-O)-methylase SpoU
MRRPTLPDVRDICTGKRRIAILENIVNPTNIGAIFRSAAALNIDAILLTPACSNPLYRRAIRVSMGTVFQIPWTYLDGERSDASIWPQPGMQILQDMGFKTVAMALTDDSVSINDPQLGTEEKLAIVLGTEGDGLADTTIANCDYTVRIPMSHGVDSLNVAAASAVTFWELAARNQV